MKQYWLKIKYAHDGVERWELTRGRWANKRAVLKGYEARTWAMNGTILDAKPYGSMYDTPKKAPTGCDYGIGG